MYVAKVYVMYVKYVKILPPNPGFSLLKSHGLKWISLTTSEL